MTMLAFWPAHRRNYRFGRFLGHRFRKRRMVLSARPCCIGWAGDLGFL